MSEFVKKTIVGYKDVPGGSLDPDCTHVILTLNEYKKIVRERDEAIRTVGIERQNADRQVNEANNNAAYQIRQVRDQADGEIVEMQGALAQAQKDAAYQRHEHAGKEIAEKRSSWILHDHIMGNGAAEPLFCRFY